MEVDHDLNILDGPFRILHVVLTQEAAQGRKRSEIGEGEHQAEQSGCNIVQSQHRRIGDHVGGQKVEHGQNDKHAGDQVDCELKHVPAERPMETSSLPDTEGRLLLAFRNDRRKRLHGEWSPPGVTPGHRNPHSGE